MKVPTTRPYFSADDIAKVKRAAENILASGRLIMGPYTKEFENKFAAYIGTKFAIGTSCCTSALEIVLRYINIKDGEVLVPTNTFVACPNSVVYAGGKPVFVDAEKETFCLDIEDMKEKINKNTKAIMAVHIGGLPVPQINAIRDICSDKGIFLIEDASHAHGASIDGKRVGSIGDAGCFSMLATKIITTGAGGVITTNDEKLNGFAMSLRYHGGIGANLDKIVNFGNDWLMSEIDALLGICQLERLEEMLEKRSLIAEAYYRNFKGFEGISFFPPPRNVKHGYYKVLAMLEKNIDREELRRIAKEKYEIEIGALYPIPCHMQPIYSQEGTCPVAEEIMPHQISLPVFFEMSEEQIQYVSDSLKSITNELKI